MPDLNVLDDLAIAPSLEGFSFSKDAFNFETSLFIGGPGTDDDDDGVGEPFGDVGGGNLAPMDVDGGDNTAKACVQFNEIVYYVRHENFVGTYDQFTFLDSPCSQVQSVIIFSRSV